VKNYRLTIAIILAIIVVSIGDSSMKVKKAFIKTRRTETHVTSEAYAYGDDHGDAIGVQCSIPSWMEPLISPARAARYGLMIKLCNQGIIPVTQLDGLVLCFPDGEGGIEMIEESA